MLEMAVKLARLAVSSGHVNPGGVSKWVCYKHRKLTKDALEGFLFLVEQIAVHKEIVTLKMRIQENQDRKDKKLEDWLKEFRSVMMETPFCPKFDVREMDETYNITPLGVRSDLKT